VVNPLSVSDSTFLWTVVSVVDATSFRSAYKGTATVLRRSISGLLNNNFLMESQAIKPQGHLSEGGQEAAGHLRDATCGLCCNLRG